MRYIAGLIAILGAHLWAATPVIEGDVDPVKLLEWVKYQKTISANLKVPVVGKTSGFCMKCSDENSKYTGEPMTVPLWQVGDKTKGATFFEADQDVDCDGSHDGPCNVSKDPSHQPELSCGCNANAGKLAFYVLPLGTRFNAGSRGLALGTVAAAIYKDPATGAIGMMYAPWLDEDGVQQEIGESSAYMAQQMGVDPNPETGGSDTGNTYIVFPGTGNMLTGNDRLDHAKALAIGIAAAKKLLADFPVAATRTLALRHGSLMARGGLAQGRFVTAQGGSLSVFSLNGETLRILANDGRPAYDLSGLAAGAHALRIGAR
jgi:hypothetical protein